MEGEEIDDEAFFRAVARSAARVLIIGRRGLIILGAPVMTSDYDLWVHIDDIERLNTTMAELDLAPSHPAAEARGRGRYVLEGPCHVDVMVARSAATRDDATRLAFEDAWARRRVERVGDVEVFLPELDDYVLTKRWALRARDLQDIVFLEALKRREQGR